MEKSMYTDVKWQWQRIKTEPNQW